MTNASVVQLLYDESTDITAHALVTAAKFNVAANAQPGTCEITMKDLDRSLSFVTGKRLQLIVDGKQLWSGFALNDGRGSFFPAGDGLTPTRSRKWVLQGVDNNILLDKRVFRYPTDYLSEIPRVTSDAFDGAILRTALASYIDMPSWIDITSQIDDVTVPATAPDGHISSQFPFAYPAQGQLLRQLPDYLAGFSAAVYYIGPDDIFHYHAIQDRESPWGFSDRPNKAAITSDSGFEGAYWGFRELDANEDGTEFATDALVWGGSEFSGASGGTVFARATDATLEGIHNKWQRAETGFGDVGFKTQTSVDIRANIIVFGNPTGDPSGAEPGSVPGEGPRGLRFPQWQYRFSWFTKDVPTLSGVPRHIYPGDLVPVQLWAFSEDDGVTPFTKILPLRQLQISFPTGMRDGKAAARFDGTFDLRNEDSKFLWAYLRNREKTIQQVALSSVGNSSTTAVFGSYGQFVPTPAPDGSTTVFTVPFGYIPGTTALYLNGLTQRVGTDYTESNPDAGEITLTSPPLSTDNLLVTDRTQAG